MTFPHPPQPQPDTTRAQYGLALVLYLVSAECDLYGMLTDEQLELAEHAAHIAVISRDILPAAVDQISGIRHRIAKTLNNRKEEREQAQKTAQDTETPPRGRDRQDGDPRVANTPPAPRFPPGGAYGEAEVIRRERENAIF